MEIRYVNHSIGNNFGDFIELNESLTKYPSLHKAILQHELEHTNNKGFSKDDLILDLSESKVNKVELLKFMLSNPKSFMQFAPCYWTRKHGFVYDINLILIYLFLILGISATIYFAL